MYFRFRYFAYLCENYTGHWTGKGKSAYFCSLFNRRHAIYLKNKCKSTIHKSKNKSKSKNTYLLLLLVFNLLTDLSLLFIAKLFLFVSYFFLYGAYNNS